VHQRLQTQRLVKQRIALLSRSLRPRRFAQRVKWLTRVEVSVSLNISFYSLIKRPAVTIEGRKADLLYHT
jgi:hypothetical protein